MDLALLPCCLAKAYDDEDNLVCKRYFEKLGLNEHKINYLWTKYKRISNGLGHKILNPGDVLLVYELDDSHFHQMVTNAADFKHVHRVDFKDNVYSIWNFLTLDVDAMLLFMFDLYQSNDKITPEDIIHMLKDTYHTEFDTNFNCQQIVKHEIPKFEDGVWLDVHEFSDWGKMHHHLTFPAFVTQTRLRRAMFGEGFWRDRERERNKICHNKFMSLRNIFILLFPELNLQSDKLWSELATSAAKEAKKAREQHQLEKKNLEKSKQKDYLHDYDKNQLNSTGDHALKHSHNDRHKHHAGNSDNKKSHDWTEDDEAEIEHQLHKDEWGGGKDHHNHHHDSHHSGHDHHNHHHDSHHSSSENHHHHKEKDAFGAVVHHHKHHSDKAESGEHSEKHHHKHHSDKAAWASLAESGEHSEKHHHDSHHSDKAESGEHSEKHHHKHHSDKAESGEHSEKHHHKHHSDKAAWASLAESGEHSEKHHHKHHSDKAESGEHSEKHHHKHHSDKEHHNEDHSHRKDSYKPMIVGSPPNKVHVEG
jgi:hypothetical protein